MSQIEIARKLAEKAHTMQKRKDGKPYFTHVEAVANIVESKWRNEGFLRLEKRELAGYWDDRFEFVVAAAFLHDAREDQSLELQDFTSVGLDPFIYSLVNILSRQKEENYFDFIMRIRYSIDSLNYGARLIKLADLTHNMSDLQEGSMKDKYRFAYHILSH